MKTRLNLKNKKSHTKCVSVKMLSKFFSILTTQCGCYCHQQNECMNYYHIAVIDDDDLVEVFYLFGGLLKTYQFLFFYTASIIVCSGNYLVCCHGERGLRDVNIKRISWHVLFLFRAYVVFFCNFEKNLVFRWEFNKLYAGVSYYYVSFSFNL